MLGAAMDKTMASLCTGNMVILASFQPYNIVFNKQLLSPQERGFYSARKLADSERASQVFLGSLFETQIVLKGLCHHLGQWETGEVLSNPV